MKKNILVTGRPGCGKTTLIEKVAKGIGIHVTGFITREIRARGSRVGFSIETFDGRKGILAHVDNQSPIRVGKYGVDLQVLEAIAVPSFPTSSPDTLIVIDEIGKMECFSPVFRKAVLEVLDSPNPVLASIAEKGNSFIAGIKSREDVEVHKILTHNRDLLTASIAVRIRDFLSPK